MQQIIYTIWLCMLIFFVLHSLVFLVKLYRQYLYIFDSKLNNYHIIVWMVYNVSILLYNVFILIDMKYKFVYL
jgi:hypothetical protein